MIHEFVENNSNCVLLGDFNHGPATPGLSWYLPLNYGLMTARGLLSISATFCGQCTSSSDNILTGGFPEVHIDHIYIPANQISSVRRVMVRILPVLITQVICMCIYVAVLGTCIYIIYIYIYIYIYTCTHMYVQRIMKY